MKRSIHLLVSVELRRFAMFAVALALSFVVRDLAANPAGCPCSPCKCGSCHCGGGGGGGGGNKHHDEHHEHHDHGHGGAAGVGGSVDLSGVGQRQREPDPFAV